MGQQVVNCAVCTCSQGLGPTTFVALPTHRVNAGGMCAANIMDNIAFVNIPPFPLCNSSSNPTVIAATAAALGVHTPAACIPSLPSPWSPGIPTVLVDGNPTLDSGSTLSCAYNGTISISFPGQVTVNV